MSQYPPYKGYHQYQASSSYQHPNSALTTASFSPSHDHSQNASYTMSKGLHDFSYQNIPGLPPTRPPQSDSAWAPAQVSYDTTTSYSHQPPPSISSYLYQQPAPATGSAVQGPPPGPSYTINAADDADLDEGEFEGLYGPYDSENSHAVTKNGTPADQTQSRLPVAQSAKSTPVDVLDNGFYGSGSEAGEISSANGRERAPQPTSANIPQPSKLVKSNSRAIHQGPGASSTPINQTQDPGYQQQTSPSNGAYTSSKSTIEIPGFGPSNSQPPTAPRAMQQQNTNGQQKPAKKKKKHGIKVSQTPRSSLERVAEMKEQAKTAIQCLWPHIEYQQYIDEGINPDVLKSLFAELGYAAPVSKPATQKRIELSALAAHDKSRTSKDMVPAVLGGGNSAALVPSSGSDDKAEARKDRIARLLALKKSKNTQPGTDTPLSTEIPVLPKPTESKPTDEKSATLTSATSITSNSTVDLAPKPKTGPSPKDVLLQQKMEALERSRAARAQKAVEKAITQPEPASALVQESQKVITGGLASTTSLPPKPTMPGLGFTSNLTPATQRKRPVASDFSIDASDSCNKRSCPSQHTDTPSQDANDEDIGMEAEGEDSNPESPKGPPPGPAPRPGLLPVRSHSSLDLSTLNRTVMPSSPVPLDSTPPASGVSTPKNLVNDLERRAREIEVLKKRIAEAEARKAANKPTQALVPNTLSTSSISLSDTKSKTGTMSLPTAPVTADSPINVPKRNEPCGSDSRQQTRNRIMSVKLPQLELSVQEKMAKVKVLEEELATIRADLRASLEEKQRLTEEVNRIDGEPEDTTRVNGVVCNQAQSEPRFDSSSRTESSHKQTIPVGSTTHPATNALSEPSPHSEKEADEIQLDPEVLQQVSCRDSPSLNESQTREREASSELSQPSTEDQPMLDAAPIVRTRPSIEVSASQLEGTTRETADTSQPHSSLSSVTSSSEDTDEDDIDMADAEGPESPSQITPEKMSTENTEPVTVMDVDQQACLNHDNTGPADVDELTFPKDDLLPQIHLISARSQAAEDASSSTPPRIPASTGQVISTLGTAGAATQSRLQFVPYESPLTMFKAYRFHPKYHETVNGGLKSLTYSNKINPNLELCSIELLEGLCSDDQCPHQHIKSIAAAEDQILLELGSSDMYKGERKVKFTQGLRTLLTDLRSKKIRQFDVLAREIVAYRARFNGDTSKVLPLEGVEI